MALLVGVLCSNGIVIAAAQVVVELDVRAFLVQPRQPGVSSYVGGQNGGKLAGRVHGRRPGLIRVGSLPHHGEGGAWVMKIDGRRHCGAKMPVFRLLSGGKRTLSRLSLDKK